MNRDCQIVQDIMPLYVDDICSEASREMLEAHVSGCPECQALLEKLRNVEVEEEFIEEKNEIIKKQARFFKRKSFVVGTVFAGIFAFPILICLIVNISIGFELDWFFIVISSLILAASLIVTPLMAPKNKFLWTIGLSVAALILLLAVSAIFTEGSWFFVAASSVLFGLSVVLLPIVVNQRAVKEKIGNNRWLICLGADTILYWLMMFSIGCFTGNDFIFWQTTMAVSVPLLLYIWVIFVLLRYPRCSKLTRTGFAFVATGVAFFFCNTIIGWFLGFNLGIPRADFSIWDYNTINGNIYWAGMIGMVLLGLVFIIVGVIRDINKRSRK